MKLIDTHAHIYVDQFENDINDVVKRATNNGIAKILMPNIDNTTLHDMFNLSIVFPDICHPMVGLHPCSVGADWQKVLETLQPHIDNSSVIGIGETGIDLYWDKTFEKEQKESFRKQIEWALEFDLPVVIHSRAAIDVTISIIEEMQNGSLRGVFHCFDQSYNHAKKIMDVGFYMGIGGVITYRKNQELRNTIAKVPSEFIVLETDAPYLPPTPFRGKRNESSYLVYTSRQVAACKNITVEELAELTSRNAIDLFNLDMSMQAK